MFKIKKILNCLIILGFAFASSSAFAQFNFAPPAQQGNYNNQGYGYNQGYGNQNYNQGSNQNGYDYNQGYGNQNYNQGNNQQQLAPLRGGVMVAPAGTSLSITTTTGLSSAINRVGDTFTTRLSNDLYAGGGLVLPAGSTIEGQITQVESAGRTGKNGILGVRFTNAITPNGQRIPLSAKLLTEDRSGLIRGGTTAGRVGKTFLNTAIGAGIGAVLGTALAPAAGGSVGKGAVYGTAIGGGAGLLSNVVRKGSEAELPSGTQLQIILDQNLSAPSMGGSSNYPSYGY